LRLNEPSVLHRQCGAKPAARAKNGSRL
jgi:hypothetical protein